MALVASLTGKRGAARRGNERSPDAQSKGRACAAPRCAGLFAFGQNYLGEPAAQGGSYKLRRALYAHIKNAVEVRVKRLMKFLKRRSRSCS